MGTIIIIAGALVWGIAFIKVAYIDAKKDNNDTIEKQTIYSTRNYDKIQTENYEKFLKSKSGKAIINIAINSHYEHDWIMQMTNRKTLAMKKRVFFYFKEGVLSDSILVNKIIQILGIVV